MDWPHIHLVSHLDGVLRRVKTLPSQAAVMRLEHGLTVGRNVGSSFRTMDRTHILVLAASDTKTSSYKQVWYKIFKQWIVEISQRC